jgi:hypothetical protein
MNSLNSLPFEIQDYIYAFDGRYKTAMNQCITLIEERGKTSVYGNRTWACDSPFLLETERRAKMYSRYLGNDCIIRLPHKVIDPTIGREPGFCNLFRDVLGVYSVMAEQKTIWIDGEEYKSTKYYKFVGDHHCIRPDELEGVIGTTTRESKYYLLDPEVQKTLRRKDFLDHGLSPNGKRPKKIFTSR